MSLANPSASAGTMSALAEGEDGAVALAQAESEGGIVNAAILTVKGIVQHVYGRHDEAIKSCNAAAQDCPEYPPAHAVRARALASLGRPDDALQAFSSAIACDAKFAPAYADYALMVTRRGCYEDAVFVYDDVTRLAPDSGDVHAGRAFALAGAERLDDAWAACERAVRLDPGSCMAHVARGMVMGCAKRPAAALAAFDRAIQIDPGSASAHAGRGFALATLGHRARALSAYERSAQLDSGSASAHAGRGLVLEALGRRAEALSAYECAVGIDEHHVTAMDGRRRTGRREAPSDAPDPGLPGQGSHGVQGSARAPPEIHVEFSAIAYRAMDPGYAPASRYIEHCLSYAPRDGGRFVPHPGWRRSPPLTAKEISDIKEAAASTEVVTMLGSAYVDMIRKEAEIADCAEARAP